MAVPKKKIRSRRFTDTLKGFLSILLLSVYCLANLQVEVFHNLFHAHENTSIHSSEAEKDLCHRAIYHNEKDQGCKHTFHFTKAEKCDLCPLMVHNEYLSIPEFESCHLTSAPELSARSVVSKLLIQHAPLSSRAPPQV